MTLLVLFFITLFSPILLALLYIPAIQYERGGLWYAVVPIFTIPALIVDFLFNLTWVTLIYGDEPFQRSPTLGRVELTFSDRLERFVLLPGKLGNLSRIIAHYLNKFAPSGVHIKAYKHGISQ